MAVLAAAAVLFLRPLPERRVAEVLGNSAQASLWTEHVDSVGAGETVTSVLARGGVSGDEIAGLLRSATTLNPRRIRAGMRVTFGALPSDSEPRQVTLHLGVDSLLRLTRSDSGWVARVDLIPWQTDTLVVNGRIATNLYDAMSAAAAQLPASVRTELAWDVADIFEFRVDMSRDLQVGDAFAVLVERQVGAQGAVRTGRVLAALLSNGGSTVRAFRHEQVGARPRYFDQDGKSMAANFLRAPLQFRRISSVFGLRKHPILGIWRRHQGTDYAAGSGTPVRSIGDGVVIFAGRRGGYGNSIDVRHPNGVVSRYGHLRGFARGVRAGARVSMAETIGYVGMTGLATAPHLHFEILVGGVQRNPRTALETKVGEPLPAKDRPLFDVMKARYMAMLQAGTARVGDVAN